VIRGQVWTAAGKDHLGKPRPVIIIQDNRFDATDSIAVVPTTSTQDNLPLFRIRIQTGSSGLKEVSYAMVDKVATPRRTQLRQFVGEIHREELVQIERSLMVFLGLAG
jgi:mRNA interferase MazF